VDRDKGEDGVFLRSKWVKAQTQVPKKARAVEEKHVPVEEISTKDRIKRKARDDAFDYSVVSEDGELVSSREERRRGISKRKGTVKARMETRRGIRIGVKNKAKGTVRTSRASCNMEEAHDLDSWTALLWGKKRAKKAELKQEQIDTCKDHEEGCDGNLE
jgi:hypothetical protein